MGKKLLKDTCVIAAQIIEGEFDADLGYIEQACKARKKNLFRRGTKVKLVGTRSVELDGQVGTVLKVNATRISVGLGELLEYGYEQEYNVPPNMLEIVA
jgi:hypothetical protein